MGTMQCYTTEFEDKMRCGSAQEGLVSEDAVGGCSSGQDAFRALFINGHAKGSVMVRMATMEERQDTMEEKIDEVGRDVKTAIRSLDELPRRLVRNLLLGLSVLAAFIAIVTFLGPSLRKAWGMADDQYPPQAVMQHPPQDAGTTGPTHY
jgi:hypothetical protein